MAAGNLSQLVGAMGAWLEADVDGVPIEDRHRVSALILGGDVLGIALEDVDAMSGFGETDRELLDRVRTWALVEQKRRRAKARAERRTTKAPSANAASRPSGDPAAPKDPTKPPDDRPTTLAATFASLVGPSPATTDGPVAVAVAQYERERLDREVRRRPAWLTEEVMWWALATLALTIVIWRQVL